MRRLLKYDRKENLNQKKGQFFIISAVIMVSILVSIAQYIFDYGRIDLTRTQEMQELEYISLIKESLYNTAKNSVAFGCNRVEADLNETEDILIRALAQQGIDLSIKHEIICPEVSFQFNITSPGFFSKTEFHYP